MSETTKIETHCGDDIHEVAAKAVRLIEQGRQEVAFDFNDVDVRVRAGMSVANVVDSYRRVLGERRAAYEASPEYKKRQEELAERRRIEQALRAEIETRAPVSMTLRNAASWATRREVNVDPYSSAVLAYAERWARYMEAEIAAGAKLGDCADRLSRLADVEGITGFMYGGAVAMLSECWIHGEALRQWHNAERGWPVVTP